MRRRTTLAFAIGLFGIGLCSAQEDLRRLEETYIREWSGTMMNRTLPIAERLTALRGLEYSLYSKSMNRWSFFPAVPALLKVQNDPQIGPEARCFLGDLRKALSSQSRGPAPSRPQACPNTELNSTTPKP